MTLEMENRAPALRNIEELEQQRERLVADLDRLRQENQAFRDAANITETHVRKVLNWQENDIKDNLPSMVEKIILNPQTNHCEIVYSVRVASPRDVELHAVLAEIVNW
jgi:hypothetical protein